MSRPLLCRPPRAVGTRPFRSPAVSRPWRVQCRGLQQDTQVAASALPHRSQAVSKVKGILDAGEVRHLSALTVNTIQAPHVGHLKVIQLQRERAKNAISKTLLQELRDEVEQIHGETSAKQTRAVVLASGLDDVFCAGADLKERKTMSQQEVQEFLASLRHTFHRLATLPVPTIACVSGVALGGGLELALCCHLRVFSSNAVVGLPETRLGIIPGAGGTYRLAQVAGVAHARDLILTGRRVQAMEAAGMGLCDRIVAGDREGATLDPATKRNLTLGAGIALAQEIAKGGPVAVRAAISALAGGSEAAENSAYDSLLESWDRTEALRAFGEKRSPAFRGE